MESKAERQSLQESVKHYGPWACLPAGSVGSQAGSMDQGRRGLLRWPFFRLISHVQESPEMALCSLDSYSDVLQIPAEAQMGAETLCLLLSESKEN